MAEMVVRIYYCDNCGRRHRGRYVKFGAPFEAPEWDFEWTDRQGNLKLCPVCKSRRDPCEPRSCWRCEHASTRPVEVSNDR